ncbi:hypothetical protein [Thalassospira permensis]|uniref:Nudix hydrolase domain-containing protein n=1 Tax=Thalassospira permensis NBRC 106175 TaxID=1353532 RepID=A0ABR4TRM9_9PROT|nr:hypothetical protein [Thalassospira permensis]KEO58379.1 hypothetical protein SMB34_13895 [Thalassospira permensis NBRC 106175]
MIEDLISKIESDGTVELAYLLIGSIIMFLIQKVIYYAKLKARRTILSKKIKKYREYAKKTNVLSLENGDPEFAKSNLIVREASHFGRAKCLYINMPHAHLQELKRREEELQISNDKRSLFQKDQSFDGSANFQDIQQKTGINNLTYLINKHREIVAQKFLASSDGLRFNGEKYGIYDIRFTRFGENENPGAEINLFKTDYFTHRVFRSIYHELVSQGHVIKNATADNFLNYNAFLTSFGINTILICDGENGKEIVLSKRSKRVHGGKSRYHISMNEGLSSTDKDAFGNVDIELCFKRGLLEEIGIDNNIYRLANRTSFYDFFLEKTNFEVGLTSMIEIDVPFHSNIEPLIARDKAYETDSFKAIPMKAKILKKFTAEHEFVPHGLYTLNQVLLREGISLMSIDQ